MYMYMYLYLFLGAEFQKITFVIVVRNKCMYTSRRQNVGCLRIRSLHSHLHTFWEAKEC